MACPLCYERSPLYRNGISIKMRPRGIKIRTVVGIRQECDARLQLETTVRPSIQHRIIFAAIGVVQVAPGITHGEVLDGDFCVADEKLWFYARKVLLQNFLSFSAPTK